MILKKSVILMLAVLTGCAAHARRGKESAEAQRAIQTAEMDIQSARQYGAARDGAEEISTAEGLLARARQEFQKGRPLTSKSTAQEASAAALRAKAKADAAHRAEEERQAAAAKPRAAVKPAQGAPPKAPAPAKTPVKR